MKGFDGMPDLSEGKVLAFSVTQEKTIVKPQSISGNWKVLIVNYPFLNKIECTEKYGTVVIPAADQPGSNHLNYDADLATANNMYPVSIYIKDDDLDFDIFPTTGLEVPQQNRDGNTRCVGMGIEIVNTTSPLNVQGLCSVARHPQPEKEALTYRIAISHDVVPPLDKELDRCVLGKQYDSQKKRDSRKVGAVEQIEVEYISLRPVQLPPNTLADLVLSNDVQQWHAKEGSYAVVPFHIDEDQVMPPQPCWPHFYSIAPTAELPSVTTEVTWPGAHVGPYLPEINPVLPYEPYHGPQGATSWFPSESVVQMYTGLSEQTSITVRVRWIMERVPAYTERDILVLAHPRIDYDPVAIELVERAWSCLPPAVPFTDNPSGEWWKDVLATIGDVAGPLASLIPGVGPMISSGIQVGTKLLRNSAQQDKAERKQQNLADPANARNKRGKKKKKKTA